MLVPSRGLCATGAHMTRQKAPRRRYPTRFTATSPPPISPPPRLSLAPPTQCLLAGPASLAALTSARARAKRGGRIRPAAPGALDPETIVPFWRVLKHDPTSDAPVDAPMVHMPAHVSLAVTTTSALAYTPIRNGKRGGAGHVYGVHSGTNHISCGSTHIPCLFCARAYTCADVFRCTQHREPTTFLHTSAPLTIHTVCCPARGVKTQQQARPRFAGSAPRTPGTRQSTPHRAWVVCLPNKTTQCLGRTKTRWQTAPGHILLNKVPLRRKPRVYLDAGS
jgi:hypothetical protein